MTSARTSQPGTSELLDHAHEDNQAYGDAASFGLAHSCEDEVVQQLREMSQHGLDIHHWAN